MKRLRPKPGYIIWETTKSGRRKKRASYTQKEVDRNLVYETHELDWKTWNCKDHDFDLGYCLNCGLKEP